MAWPQQGQIFHPFPGPAAAAAGRAAAAVPIGECLEPVGSDMSLATRHAMGCWEAKERDRDRDGTATVRVQVRDWGFAAPFLTGVQGMSSGSSPSLAEDAAAGTGAGSDWEPSCDRSLLATGV